MMSICHQSDLKLHDALKAKLFREKHVIFFEILISSNTSSNTLENMGRTDIGLSLGK